ncbi:MAG TPA: DedA family protein [Burkholderiaceae bacterium]|nr:DedA family protein [Burkholderiaceae bacterium]
MDLVMQAVDFALHLDRHIGALWTAYGLWLYAIVFFIVFAETGLVVTPWLPGDSLLFVLGALAAAGGPDVTVLITVLFAAAVIGNTSNYWIGRWIGPKVFHHEGGSRWLSREMLDKTHGFYERHGAVTVMVSRFLPLLRTFAPFVAGIGAMPHGKFQLYSVLGGALWVGVFVLAGYFFGSIPVVKNNLPLVIVGVVIVSFMPLVIEFVRSRVARG